MGQNAGFGGKICGDMAETQVCNNGPCPIHCKVSAWSAWGKCSKSCGSGKQSRVRTILKHPKHKGFQCPSLEASQRCNIPACPVNCVLSMWHSWGACTQSCGTGTKERKRVTLVRPATNSRVQFTACSVPGLVGPSATRLAAQ